MNKASVQRTAFRAQMREAGLRSTAPRLSVLTCLFEAHTPLSHADVFVAMQDDGFDRATIFRNLNDLTDAGLVARRDLGDHTWRFELRRDKGSAKPHGDAHPHFTCTDCGTVSCLPDESVGLKAGRGVPKSVSSGRVRVTLQGVCDRCE